ncbi:hypothetical protein BO78DRAFT_435044 [Aspergillus sclerotiicarbonarius CBS 121057]|uniref:Uncharacterized protein n=1 Tax=Aspergillus sclerotiicarbonarius (strain CBS 121057 / IBT 28362) TaxID=1448318 RepID=A0A319F887_ASPSB|nr:hypothetical protein BO78DRAFT_435044 [Aspergillus sclerotiicarbonarius CBS 121057]
MAPKLLLIYEKEDSRYWLTNSPGLAVADASPLVDLTDKEFIFESELLLAVASTMEGNMVPKHLNYLASYQMGETYYVLLEKRDTLTPLTPLSSCVSETLGVRSVHSNEGCRRRRSSSESMGVSEEGQAAEPKRSGWSTPVADTRSEGHASENCWDNKDEPTQSDWSASPIIAINDGFLNWSVPLQPPSNDDHASVDNWDSKDEPAHVGWNCETGNSDGRASVAPSENKWNAYSHTTTNNNHAFVFPCDTKKDVESSNEQSAKEGTHIAPFPLVVGKDVLSNKNDVGDNVSIESTQAQRSSSCAGTTFAAKVAHASDTLKEKMPGIARTRYSPFPGIESHAVEDHTAPSANTYPFAPSRSYPHNMPHQSAFRDGGLFDRFDDIQSPCSSRGPAYRQYYWGGYVPPAYRQYVDHEPMHPWHKRHALGPRVYPGYTGYVPPMARRARPTPIPPVAPVTSAAPIPITAPKNPVASISTHGSPADW